jgi:Flp pilus assembly protein TadG
VRLRVASEQGSAPVEFLLVSVLLIALAAGVVQFALAMHVRSSIHDAAVEGARWGSRVGATAAESVQRTRELITLAVGDQYAATVSARDEIWQGLPARVVSVRADVPLVGFWGAVAHWEEVGHAVRETSP